MKVGIPSDSYKESLKAIEVCEEIERGVEAMLPKEEYVKIPIGGGGEGTVYSLVAAARGRIISLHVTGPLRECVQAFYGMSKDKKTAFIEMAAASVLQHVPDKKRKTLVTKTKGTGEPILHALDESAEHIILGLGGSATNDGVEGMFSALRVRFITGKGEVIY
ncbi:glycerate kinase, partial [Bacillus sp. S1-R5C1-FB]|uniref:glycerate kinase n=1 Tax=Bacillus sp. S1-R5C1-FB TaxID=1973491 RepID=UPI001154FF09